MKNDVTMHWQEKVLGKNWLEASSKLGGKLKSTLYIHFK